MCGRFAFLLPHESWRGLYKVLNDFPHPPRYNVAPTQPIVVILEREGRRTAELFRWGFVPGWVKDPREWPLLINARAETMAEKPAFRDAVRNSRCIVPANGYFEWMKGPNGKRQALLHHARRRRADGLRGPLFHLVRPEWRRGRHRLRRHRRAQSGNLQRL